jgi:hypothetical protein
MIKHIVVGGCSFTSNGIGGVPPTLATPEGGCSFVGEPANVPVSWPGFIAQQLKVSSLINLAASGHGNFLTANNILTLLQSFPYHSKDTLVLFNITDPGRFDLMCDFEQPSKSKSCDWNADILPFSYVNRNTDVLTPIVKLVGLDQVELITSTALLGMMSFLAQNNFTFRFLTMSDYSDHKHLAPVIQRYKHNFINLHPGIGMQQYVSILNLNTTDGFHPDLAGHQAIAKCVIESLSHD